MNLPQAEVIALDSMRAASPGCTAEDLDVPAFMRRRNDVMQEIHEAVCFRVADDPGTILHSAVPLAVRSQLKLV